MLMNPFETDESRAFRDALRDFRDALRDFMVKKLSLMSLVGTKLGMCLPPITLCGFIQRLTKSTFRGLESHWAIRKAGLNLRSARLSHAGMGKAI